MKAMKPQLQPMEKKKSLAGEQPAFNFISVLGTLNEAEDQKGRCYNHSDHVSITFTV